MQWICVVILTLVTVIGVDLPNYPLIGSFAAVLVFASLFGWASAFWNLLLERVFLVTDSCLWHLTKESCEGEVLAQMWLLKLKSNARALLAQFEREDAFRATHSAAEIASSPELQEEQVAITQKTAHMKEDFQLLRNTIEELLPEVINGTVEIPAAYNAVAEMNVKQILANAPTTEPPSAPTGAAGAAS